MKTCVILKLKILLFFRVYTYNPHITSINYCILIAKGIKNLIKNRQKHVHPTTLIDKPKKKFEGYCFKVFLTIKMTIKQKTPSHRV